MIKAQGVEISDKMEYKESMDDKGCLSDDRSIETTYPNFILNGDALDRDAVNKWFEKELESAMNTVASTELNPLTKIATLRAVKGETISIPIDLEKEGLKQKNLKANGYRLEWDTKA